ncbi:MAG: beta-lactamase family protein [Acidimicrobiia bacterium]|nr:beta-lactamase family protein [Acidimicrobiia bacterium]
MTFARTLAVMTEGLDRRAYPAIVCEVGRADGPRWRHALGTLTYNTDAPPCRESTVFDLASLTKVIATTSLTMRAVRDGRLSLSSLVRDDITVAHLLDHSSGLPAHRRLWETVTTAVALREAVLDVPQERPAGIQAVYSDIGFMTLGFLLEACMEAPLDQQWRGVWPHAGDRLDFLQAPSTWSAIAPTERDSWRGRLLQGEVHDEHAALLGGVAAHSGLFGNAAAVGRFAASVLESFHRETWLATPSEMHQWACRRPVPGSSRALGWDTMLPTSSCGTRMSPTAIGHTGFTGTSLWIDWERDCYVVILTNRVHPTRTNEVFVPMRARLHDAIAEDLA